MIAELSGGATSFQYAGVAQLDRVTGYEPVGRGFESLHPYHVGASYISLAPTFSKVRARSLRRSSFPNRTRFAGLRFGFGRDLERRSILPTYCTSEQAAKRLLRFFSTIRARSFFSSSPKMILKKSVRRISAAHGLPATRADPWAALPFSAPSCGLHPSMALGSDRGLARDPPDHPPLSGDLRIMTKKAYLPYPIWKCTSHSRHDTMDADRTVRTTRSMFIDPLK